MSPAATEHEKQRDALVIGDGSFIEGRLVRVLEAGGFSVQRALDPAKSYGLGMVGLPGGPEVALLFSAGVRLVAVEERIAGESASNPGWPFDDIVHDGMSAEHILHVCNDVFFRDRGQRRYRRYALALDVIVAGEGRVIRTNTSNFSEGGAFVRSLVPFGRGTELKLRLVSDPALDEISGQVVYAIGPEGDHLVNLSNPDRPVVAHPGMAVRFDEGQEKTASRWMRASRWGDAIS